MGNYIIRIALTGSSYDLIVYHHPTGSVITANWDNITIRLYRKIIWDV